MQLERQRPAGPVMAARYPAEKQEWWWLVVGDADNSVLAIKRLTCDRHAQATMQMDVPAATAEAGVKGREFKLSFMCDSYLGADQEYEFVLRAVGGAPMDQD